MNSTTPTATGRSVRERLLKAQHSLAEGDLELAVLEISKAHEDIEQVPPSDRALCGRMVSQLLEVMAGVRDALGAESSALVTQRHVAQAYADTHP